jgi:hypothetical protein
VYYLIGRANTIKEAMRGSSEFETQRSLMPDASVKAIALKKRDARKAAIPQINNREGRFFLSAKLDRQSPLRALSHFE